MIKYLNLYPNHFWPLTQILCHNKRAPCWIFHVISKRLEWAIANLFHKESYRKKQCCLNYYWAIFSVRNNQWQIFCCLSRTTGILSRYCLINTNIQTFYVSITLSTLTFRSLKISRTSESPRQLLINVGVWFIHSGHNFEKISREFWYK